MTWNIELIEQACFISLLKKCKSTKNVKVNWFGIQMVKQEVVIVIPFYICIIKDAPGNLNKQQLVCARIHAHKILNDQNVSVSFPYAIGTSLETYIQLI